MDMSASPVLDERLEAVRYLAQKKIEEEIHKVFPDWGSHWKLFGSTMKVAATAFDKPGGLVRRYKLFPGGNAVNLGITTPDTPVPAAADQAAYTNLLITSQHINDIEHTVMYSDRFADFVEGKIPDIGGGANYLVGECLDGWNSKVDALMTADRRAIVGTLTADPGVPTEDTTNKYFYFDLSVGDDVLMAAFLRGSVLQAAAPPTLFGPVTTLRNFTAPLRVIGRPSIGYVAASSSMLRVRVASKYTDATRVAVLAQMTAITTADVLGPWAGPTDDVTDMPLGGFNYGLAGLLFWLTKNSVGNFANIEEAGGGVTAALTTEQSPTAVRTISRNDASGEWDFLNPNAMYATGGPLDIKDNLTLLDDMAVDFLGRVGTKCDFITLAHPLMVKRMKQGVGIASTTFQASSTQAGQALLAKYGVSGFEYQGMSSRPYVVGENICLPPNLILFERQLEAGEEGAGSPPLCHISPKTPGWKRGTVGGMWDHRRNAAAEITHSWQATYQGSTQVFPNTRLDDRLGVILGIKAHA